MRPKQPGSDKLARNVVALAKKNAKSAFPNPNRTGCPSPSVLRAMAHRDKPMNPADLPISHVANCSPCFREYSRQRRNAKIIRTVQVTAGSLIVGGILWVAVILVLNHTRRSGLPSVSRQQNVEPASPSSVPPPSPPPQVAVPIAMTVDLAPFSPTRGEEPMPAKHIQLPPKWIRASFLMPIGSEPGEYDVRLLRSDNEVVLKTRTVAGLDDGITSFQVELHLEELSQNQLKLMIRPAGLGWRTFPVSVERLQKASPPLSR
jgi:hypothetical protein